MGRNFRLNVIPKVAVIDFLSDRPLIATCFDPLCDSVWLAKGAYLSGIWSKLITKDSGVDIWISLASFLSVLGFPVWMWCMFTS